MKLIIIGAFSLVSICSWAEDTVESRLGPCKQVLESCKRFISDKTAAGEKKSLYKDCMQPLLGDGPIPAGLSIETAQVEACKKKKSQIKQSE